MSVSGNEEGETRQLIGDLERFIVDDHITSSPNPPVRLSLLFAARIRIIAMT